MKRHFLAVFRRVISAAKDVHATLAELSGQLIDPRPLALHDVQEQEGKRGHRQPLEIVLAIQPVPLLLHCFPRAGRVPVLLHKGVHVGLPVLLAHRLQQRVIHRTPDVVRVVPPLHHFLEALHRVERVRFHFVNRLLHLPLHRLQIIVLNQRSNLLFRGQLPHLAQHKVALLQALRRFGRFP